MEFPLIPKLNNDTPFQVLHKFYDPFYYSGHMYYRLNLRELIVQLRDVVEVHTLGIHLGVPHSRLAVIRKNFPTDHDQQKSDMLNTWLENDGGKSWKKVVDALVLMGDTVVARMIAQKYCPEYVFAGKLMSNL